MLTTKRKSDSLNAEGAAEGRLLSGEVEGAAASLAMAGGSQAKRVKTLLPAQGNIDATAARVDGGSDDGDDDEDDDDNDNHDDNDKDEHESQDEDDSGTDLSASDEDGHGEAGAGHGPAGTTAYGRAFRKIMKKKISPSSLTDALGPVLSSHKQLITKKLEEAATERKARSENKKEKHILREKGHQLPTRYPSANDRDLIKLATRGVVKLFNAVSKAQSVQDAAKTSKDSEAKEVAKRSKSTFLAVLKGDGGTGQQTASQPALPSTNKETNNGREQPGWSALQDNFMLGKSRLKDWDTKEDVEEDVQGIGSSDSE